MHKTIEIMDTTLRDGEQTDGVSFSTFEKKQIARFLLEKLKVDRIEIASARVSDGEHESMKEILTWAKEKKLDHRIEMLGFTDHKGSVDWIKSCGCSTINLLTKGSRRHCEVQLGKKLSAHLEDIYQTIDYAHSQKVRVNVYLEDWSNGYLHSKDYVREMIKAIREMKIKRIFLPDTLGIMSPEEVFAGISDIYDLCNGINIEFHGHNDYNLAVANCLSAIRAGASGIHVSVNGLGERAGNAPLESVVTAIHDKLKLKTRVHEKSIMDASRLVETFSGKRIQSNRPIVGQDVYTQTAGIHADGDKKDNLYANPILPERFGRQRVYALGKLAGKASIANNLKIMGIELSKDKELMLLNRIKDLGERQKTVTADDLPFLIQDMFGSKDSRQIQINDVKITSSLNLKPKASIVVSYKNKKYKSTGEGDGGYDAFMNALKQVTPKMGLELPQLIDYEVRIPPGGKTNALVEAIIIWKMKPDSKKASDQIDGSEFSQHTRTHMKTTGVSPDQNIAAVRATEKMLNALVLADIAE